MYSEIDDLESPPIRVFQQVEVKHELREQTAGQYQWRPEDLLASNVFCA